MSKNSLVASMLDELADYSEMEDDQPYRARAYRRAAQTISSMEEDIENLSKKGSLKEIPGVGEGIEKKIVEILKTGKLVTLEKMKQRNAVDVTSLAKVEGIGPKTVKALYKELKIRNLDELESAIKDGRLADFRGLGVKDPNLLLERIQSAKLQSNRVLLVEAENIAKRVESQLLKFRDITRFEITGSFRRKKDTVGDLDVLVETEKPEHVVQNFTKTDEVREIIVAGEYKASVKFAKNFQVDLRVVPSKSWGAALLYFTGSKAHNIELRTRALKMKYHLSEYGLFKEDNETMVAGKSEQEVYKALGMDYIEPELRENRGEIQAAVEHKLPNLISLEDIRGDLQMHTTWSDGAEDIRTMAEAARALGYEYIAITDHIGSLKIANAMDASTIKQQQKEIEKINDEYEKEGTDFHVIQGAEVNIKADATLDMSNSVLKNIQLVLASIHSGFSDDVPKIMKRFSGAFENENVDIIAHPSGRLILERSGYRFELAEMIEKSLATETILEIDAYPNRLDLNDENAFDAIKAGCTLSIDTDSHTSSELAYMKGGLEQARRAWAKKSDILNTRKYKDLVRFLES
ncbi:MAG: DNA polymerase/3'-5' exonuclease PolX [archaeon]|nr:DNA polymerase/3'-5' exonuclease PolX [archaeon]